MFYEMGIEEDVKLTVTYCIHYETVMFDGQRLKESREYKENEIRVQMKKNALIQAKMDAWQPAIDWAREHGARIRKGKVSKHLARVRIDEAGLRTQWNELYPDYAFSEKDVRYSKMILKDREELYSKFKKRKKK